VTISLAETAERRRIRVRGVVQGVGFRPFVHRLATRSGLAGFVLNDGEGVIVEVEGPSERLDRLVDALTLEAPPLARIDSVTAKLVPTLGETRFVVAPSLASGRSALVPPDVATCDACLAELFDPADRRYRYPFLNCTDCGPRFTIVTAAPYDRSSTTMAGFPLCAACRREYEDPADRRFHAEPIACPVCGPQLDVPLERAVRVLLQGGIVAVKGLGGYHLACDATDDEAVARLRARKRREEKPLAILTAEPEALADLSPAEDALLRSRERPVVIARRRPGAPLSEAVAPGSAWVGLLLPYTPLHHLLAADTARPLVLTSGNLTDEPIAFDDADARRRLGHVADLFLGHDRPIHRRCEDSVVRAEFPIRRSRGHTPRALGLPVPAPRPLVAAGAELKSTFCVAREHEAYLSAHLGDLSSEGAYAAFRADLSLYLDMLGVEPAAVACDLHPDYLATRWAWDQGLPVVEVQHHHAHAAACLAEHGATGPALAVVLDGTGFGEDGTVWGGELLRCDLTGILERVAHLEPVPLPGGDAAVREPWRVAAAYLEQAGRPVPWERWGAVRESIQVNAPLSSSAGRLFDAASALLGVRERVTYEGQAAVELEQLAGGVPAEPYACRVTRCVVHGPDLVAAAQEDLQAGRDRRAIAAAFHEGVARAFATACLDAGDELVVLSGGCFQNLRLLESLRGRLEAAGRRVLTHRTVPPNDGGVSYGQAAVAAARLARCA